MKRIFLPFSEDEIKLLINGLRALHVLDEMNAMPDEQPLDRELVKDLIRRIEHNSERERQIENLHQQVFGHDPDIN